MGIFARFTRLAAAALVAAGLGLTARTAAAEPLEIRVGWANMPSHLIPVLFEQPEILKHYGISYTVEPVSFKGSSPQISALAAGQIDVSTMSPSAMALATRNARMNLKMFADVYQEDGAHKTLYLLVRKDSGIETVADLKGKRVATNVQGSALDVTVRMMLDSGGLNAARDVNLIEVRFPEAPAMLAEQKVDFAPVVQPFAQALLDSGEYRELADPTVVQGGLAQLVFLAAKTDYIAENRAALVDFTEDYIRAVRWFHDPANREAAIAIIADYMQVPPARLGELFTTNDFYREPWAVPNVAGAQLAIDGAVKVGMLPSGITMADHSDLSIVEEARRRIEP